MQHESTKAISLLHIEPLPSIVGFFGGAVTMLNDMPNQTTASLIGSGAVSIFLALCTIVGQSIGKWAVKEGKRRWSNYKANRK